MKLKINEDQYTDAAGWDDHVFKVPYLQLYGNRFNTRVKDNKLSTVTNFPATRATHLFGPPQKPI